MDFTVSATKYAKTMDIRNLAAMPHGLNARYLLCIEGQGDELIAKQWLRKIPATISCIEVLLDMEVK